MLLHHISSHTENLCYKNAGIGILQMKYVGHVAEVECESGARGRLNMFFVQIFAVILLNNVKFGIVCTYICFYC